MAPPGMKYYYKEGVYETPPPSKPRSQFSIETMSWAIQGYYKQLYGSGWFAKPKQNWDAAEEVPDLKPNTGDWSSGLFDCCNSDHCIRGCCYPCCMFGDIVAALPRETGGVCCPGSFCMACCGHWFLGCGSGCAIIGWIVQATIQSAIAVATAELPAGAAAAGQAPTFTGVLVSINFPMLGALLPLSCIVPCCVLSVLCHGPTRGAIRKQSKIDAEWGKFNFVQDCAVSCCCSCCTLIQEYEHVVAKAGDDLNAYRAKPVIVTETPKFANKMSEAQKELAGNLSRPASAASHASHASRVVAVSNTREAKEKKPQAKEMSKQQAAKKNAAELGQTTKRDTVNTNGGSFGSTHLPMLTNSISCEPKSLLQANKF